jgi:oligopeptide/dipeptide ABC transporter ATP-binding protein
VSLSERPLLEVEDLRVSFPITKGLVFRRRIGDVRAVDGVSLNIWRGQTLGLVGESGSGKSTFARSVVGLHRPTAGRIIFDGQDIGTLDRHELRRVRRRFQMIFQDPLASLDPRMTAGASIAEPLEIHHVATRAERRARVAELLGLVGLDARLADRYPHELSGGQRQRVGVARALSLHPDLVVADEPVSALDVSIQAQIINLLRALQRDLGLTYIVIAHDLAVVRHVSDVIAVMYLGKIAESADAEELYREPLHPYTVALLSAVPIPDPAVEATRQRIVLRGDVPSPAAPPSGCPFHSRCWLREVLGNPEICSSEVPPLRTVRSGHRVACHFAEETTGRSESAVARIPDPDVSASQERS